MSFGCKCFTRRALHSHFQRVYAPHISNNIMNNKDNNKTLQNKKINCSNYSINNNLNNEVDSGDDSCSRTASTYCNKHKTYLNKIKTLNSEQLLFQDRQNCKNSINNSGKKITKVAIAKLLTSSKRINNANNDSTSIRLNF